MDLGRLTDPDDKASIRYALAGAFMLLAAVASGILCAWLLSRLVGNSYVTFLMPTAAGCLIGLTIGGVARLTGARDGAARPVDRLAIVAAVLLAVGIGYVGHHVISYFGGVELLASYLPNSADRLASEPAVEVVNFLESRTGEQGYMAYLTFTARDGLAGLSPIGLLAQGRLGSATILMIAALELALFAFMGIVTALRRARG